MAIWIPDIGGRDGPIYLQIVDAMAEDIASGRLPAGTRLPPHRELAHLLNVSANTTSRAYAEAVKRALLRGEVGRGTYVRSTGPSLDGEKPQSLHRRESGPVDLSRNLPLAGFSEPHIRRVLGDISEGNGLPALLDYQNDGALDRHREAGKVWLTGCGVDADVDEIVPTMGGQHGIMCALMALLKPGDLLLTEALTYMPVHAVAQRLGLHTAAVALDDDGVDPDAFETICRTSKPTAFYLTPTLQAPTTVTLSDARRKRLADIAMRHRVLLIEDDVFGPLKSAKPIPLAEAAADITVYVTSLSKAVAPGLRVGFVKAPRRFAPALHHAVNLSIWMTPPMTLEVSSRLIQDGTATRLAAQQRRMAERRQGMARSALGTATFKADPQGYHVWLLLPEGWRSDAFTAQCARLGAQVSEGRSFAIQAGEAPEAIRLCISHEASEDRVRRGLDIVADVLRLAPSASPLTI